MPFTFAHPVFVLPLARPLRRLPFSALVIGSMTPDVSIFFPYLRFHNLRLDYVFDHSLVGIFTVDLAVGLMIFVLFHGIFKFPLLALLPMPMARRLLPVAQGTRLLQPLTAWLAVAAALIFGALTHLWVDSCTHGYGWPVQHFTFLHSQVSLVHLPVNKVLQYAFSVLGLAGIAIWCGHWLRRATMTASVAQVRQTLQPLPPAAVVRGGAGATTALALACGLWYSFGMRQDLAMHTQLRTVVAHICVGGTPIVAVTLFFYACLWNHFHANRPQETGRQ